MAVGYTLEKRIVRWDLAKVEGADRASFEAIDDVWAVDVRSASTQG